MCKGSKDITNMFSTCIFQLFIVKPFNAEHQVIDSPSLGRRTFQKALFWGRSPFINMHAFCSTDYRHFCQGGQHVK